MYVCMYVCMYVSMHVCVSRQTFTQVVNHEWEQIPFSVSSFSSTEMAVEWDALGFSLKNTRIRQPAGESALCCGFTPLHVFY